MGVINAEHNHHAQVTTPVIQLSRIICVMAGVTPGGNIVMVYITHASVKVSVTLPFDDSPIYTLQALALSESEWKETSVRIVRSIVLFI